MRLWQGLIVLVCLIGAGVAVGVMVVNFDRPPGDRLFAPADGEAE